VYTQIFGSTIQVDESAGVAVEFSIECVAEWGVVIVRLESNARGRRIGAGYGVAASRKTLEAAPDI
jgi:hypothetical protein